MSHVSRFTRRAPRLRLRLRAPILCALALWAVAACASASPAVAANTNTIARMHWLGKKRLASEPNAVAFMRIWNEPESVRLEKQTLDKLALAPWRLLHVALATNPPSTLNPSARRSAAETAQLSTNQPSTLFRPLLDDMVREESYVEVSQAANQPFEMVFAIRLPDGPAGLWKTNLAAVLESLTGIRAADRADNLPGWTLKKHHEPNLIELARAGEWTLLGAAQGHNNLLDTLLARIQRDHDPFPARATNFWLEAEVDLRRVAAAPSPKTGGNWFPAATLALLRSVTNLPFIHVTAIGDGENIRTRGEARFPAPLPLKLDAWNIPTNIIRDPLVSFTAMRGVAPWLGSWSAWSGKGLGPAPNQVFFWAQSPATWQHFLTYPVAHGSNHISTLGDYVIRELNPIFQTNRVGGFAWATNVHRLVWKGVPFFEPMLEQASFNHTDFAVFGLFPNNATNRPVPPGLFEEFKRNPNLVYYDWEITGPQVRSWTQMGQLIRMVFGRAQLSPSTASLPWLRSIIPNLGNAATVMTLDAPDRISLKRSSPCGLTAVELQLLADWLESPEFPVGLHTQLAPRIVHPPAASAPKSTNSVAH